MLSAPPPSFRLTAAPPAFLRAGACVLTAIAIGSLAPSVLGDELRLKNGKVFEGELIPVDEDGRIGIRLGNGAVVRFPESEVASTVTKESPIARFDRQFARLVSVRSGDEALEPLVRLLVWAREKKLRGRAEKAAERILAIDSNHELARWTLGYVVFQNRWVKKKDLRRRKDLVEVDGEWMTRAEKARREREERAREVRSVLALLESPNGILRQYAIEELAGRTRKRDAVAIATLGERVRDRNAVLRAVVLAQLAEVPVKTARDIERFDARRIALELHRLGLVETDPTVRPLLRRAVTRFFPEESFRLAIDESAVAPPAGGRAATETRERRIAELLELSVQKAWVPKLCRAVSDGGERPAVRRALVRIFGEDFGYDASKWLAHWRARASEFRDVK